MKEVRRFLKVQTQTIWAPAVTTLLFLVIFTVALGRGGREVLGVPFASFVAPGLIVMGMMQNAFANSSFSLLSGKIQGTIIDLLMPPLSAGELMAGIVAAAVTRAVAVGCTVALAMALWPGVTLSIAHLWAIVWFGLMGSVMLSLFGLATSVWAEKFDHNAAITNFVIAPLSLLSGTFYIIENLSPAFETVSRLNPFFYVISGFRYGFLGQSDIGTAGDVIIAAIGIGAFNAAIAIGVYLLLRSGWKLKS
jgi:ABC-2 type transport system permease protein